jgi:tRNA threonylcarbamoyl adenosine modification protein (Sua5/YciO/YrdC/YwlC family)
MSQMFTIHADNPQSRLLRQAALCIESGGLIVYPTDSGYALGCSLGNKAAVERIRSLRQLSKTHHMTLVSRDLSELGLYALVTKPIYRLLKAFTPGAYTFVLNASHDLAKLMVHPKRKTVGLRIPTNSICVALLENLNTPIMSTSLKLPGYDYSLSEPEAIKDLLGQRIDLIIDGGVCSHEPTTVVDLTSDYPKIIRNGKGDPTPFL